MIIDLSKTIYRRLEDGEYTIIPQSWELKANATDYVALRAKLKDTDRPVTINLFQKGLDITAANVIEFLNLEELSLAEVLTSMEGEELPAYHETVVIEGKTYYNWYICSMPKNIIPEDEDAF